MKGLIYNLELVKNGNLIITDEGEIYRVKYDGRLFRSEYITGYGYYQVSSYMGNYKYATCLSHRLIYAHNHGIESLQNGLVIHHIDFNKTNNQIENLALITKEENSHLGDGRYFQKVEGWSKNG